MANSATIKQATDERGGVVELTETSSNDGDATLALGDNVGSSFVISKNSKKKFWFEARIKCVTVLNDYNLFCGFAEEASGASGGLITNSGGVVTDSDMLGFHIDEANGDAMDFIHANASTHTVKKAGFHVPVADKYFKIGLTFDGRNTVRPWLNGETVDANKVLVDAANFPDGEQMTFYLCYMGTSVAASIVSIDWVRIAMELG